jgi:membrane dipeptidase
MQLTKKLAARHAQRPFAGTSFEKKKAVRANEACAATASSTCLCRSGASPRIAMALALGLTLTSALHAQEETSQEVDLATSALLISQRTLLVDTHVDMPYRLEEGWADVTISAPDRNFDYPRGRTGGLNVPFMSIYTPAEMEETGGAYQLANQLIDSVEALTGRAPGKFAMVHSTAQVEGAGFRGLMGLALGMENGTPIEGDLDKLRHFHNRGVRYITLAHSMSNHIADSSYDENRRWKGLSPFGKEVVAEMNRLGIMVDISHVSDEAFYQVLEISGAPVIASHSSARYFTPGWERNMSDEMIKALAENGGVIMINFGSSFLTNEARLWYESMDEVREAWSAESGFPEDSPETEAWQLAYREEHPFPFATVSDLADHFDRVIALVGVEHVGIGSDFDGVGDSLPVGMKGVSDYPNLVEEFLRRGYSEEAIQAILGANLMRVWREVETYAASLTD